MAEPAAAMEIPVEWYDVGPDLLPSRVSPQGADAIVVVNYFGLVPREFQRQIASQFPNVIIDNSQAFFSPPVENAHTIYSCRKFFGVPDGAYLYTDKRIDGGIGTDASHDRFAYLFKRMEMGAEAGYADFKSNEEILSRQPIMEMSLSTQAVMRGIDSGAAERIRDANYEYLHGRLAAANYLAAGERPNGPMCYPFWVENGRELKKTLIENRIYVPTYWADALARLAPDAVETGFVNDIVPIPLDQRYGMDDMEHIVRTVRAATPL
jgi:hypothetical protein